MANRPATERPRYELVECTFADGTRADFERSPYVVEFIPVTKTFAAVRAFHRRQAWQAPFTLAQITRRDFRRARRLREIRYCIALGGKRVYLRHPFKASDHATLSSDAIRGKGLFITGPASAVMGHKRFGSREIVQFAD